MNSRVFIGNALKQAKKKAAMISRLVIVFGLGFLGALLVVQLADAVPASSGVQDGVRASAPMAPAIPPLPFSPYGTVKVNGENVPTSTVIGAWCGGVQMGDTQPEIFEGESWYAMDIPGGDQGCAASETVSYTIDELTAHQTSTWASGVSVRLDLTAFRPIPDVGIEKRTNGADADSAPGPYVLVGEAVTWTYVVSNTGNVTLTEVTVSDDRQGSVSCPKDSLAVREWMTCTVKGMAVEGQYANVGTTSGVYESRVVSDTDGSYYYGAITSLEIEKHTNGEDADSAPGPYAVAGDPVNWTYTIGNAGNVTLTNVTVVDDKGVGVSCPKTVLGADEWMTCTATGSATVGQYANTGIVTATAPVGGDLIAQDASHYYGIDAGIAIEKHTNGEDADAAPGPTIVTGDAVTWTYTVTNTGDLPLTDVTVTDDRGVTVSCPKTALAVAEWMVCTAKGTAVTDQYANIGTAEGYYETAKVSDTDPSHYFGTNPGVEIEKRTNGQDADLPPGPTIVAGEPLTWTYIVTNIGNVLLSSVTVTDDQGITVDCPKTVLAVDESMTCSASGSAELGQYSNVGTVSGTALQGMGVVSDADSSHYYGKRSDYFVYLPLVIR